MAIPRRQPVANVYTGRLGPARDARIQSAMDCFGETFCRWHATCTRRRNASFDLIGHSNKLAMLTIELHNRDPEPDPVPCFATSTEIEMADHLKRQLEQRLLLPSELPPVESAPSTSVRADARSADADIIDTSANSHE